MNIPPLVSPKKELSSQEKIRYARHLTLPGIGDEGQRRISNSKVLCIGAGGLGSPILLYLAAAGVQQIGIIDFDVVDESNLQRQIIHGTTSVNKLKSVSAKQKINELNPLIKVVEYPFKLTSINAIEIFSEFDLVIDGSDNFRTRYLANDTALLLKKPYIWGSIYQFDGQSSVFWGEHGPCYRCLHPEPPAPGSVASCEIAGVFGVMCAVIGSLQATEALKIITGIGEPLIGKILTYDALSANFRTLEIKKNPECLWCSSESNKTKLLDSYEEFCGEYEAITAQELILKINKIKNIKIVDVREAQEFESGNIKGAVHIPLSQLLSGEKNSILMDSEEVIFYCESGSRSNTALIYAKTNKFSKSTHLAGGYKAYIKEINRQQI
jgi:adenylyltransferase/sulfurtransferase